MSNILREFYIREIKDAEEGLKKINKLQQSSEKEDRTVLIRKSKEYMNKGRIQIKLVRNSPEQLRNIYDEWINSSMEEFNE